MQSEARRKVLPAKESQLESMRKTKKGHVKTQTQLEWTAVNAEKKDLANVMDNPLERYRRNWKLRRVHPEVLCRKWSWRAEPSGPQPCRLCQKRDFDFRED